MNLLVHGTVVRIATGLLKSIGHGKHARRKQPSTRQWLDPRKEQVQP